MRADKRFIEADKREYACERVREGDFCARRPVCEIHLLRGQLSEARGELKAAERRLGEVRDLVRLWAHKEQTATTVVMAIGGLLASQTEKGECEAERRLGEALSYLELAQHKIQQTLDGQYTEGQALRVAYEAVRDARAVLASATEEP